MIRRVASKVALPRGEIAIGAHKDRGQSLNIDTREPPARDNPERRIETRDPADHKVAARAPAEPHAEGVPPNVSAFLLAQNSVPRKSFFARLFGRSPVPKRLRTQYGLARGDVAIIDVLSQLGPDWLVRTCVPAPGGGIEHVVVGPSGNFCIVACHEPGGAIWIDGGTLLADGERRTHLRDTEFSAVRLTQVMSDAVGSRVDVTPCLVLLGTRSVTVAKPPQRVAVMTPRDIRSWLKGMPAVIPKEQLDSLRECTATRPEWHSSERQQQAAGPLAMFRRVHAEMTQARHVRLTWITGALVLVWLIAVVSIGGMTTNFFVN